MSVPQIIIDTNVIVSASKSQRGASAKLLSLLGLGLFDVHISIPLVLEYEAVFLRKRLNLGLSSDEVAQYIDAFCALSIPHQIYFRWRPFLRDLNDDFLLELAIAGNCEFIVTYNLRDFVGVEQFGIQAVTPKTFLEEIGAI